MQGVNLYFKGKANRDETIRDLLNNEGMNSAAEIVIAGCSAGGLGVYLGIDQIANIIHNVSSKIIVRGLVDSGYFMEYSSDYPTEVTHHSYGKDESVVDGLMDYARGMRNVFDFANIMPGTHPACIAAHTHSLVKSTTPTTSKGSGSKTNSKRNSKGKNTSPTNNSSSNIVIKTVAKTFSTTKYGVPAAGTASDCIFAANVVPYIKTPLFSLQVES